MRKLFFAFAASIVAYSSFAQNSVADLTLGILMPQPTDELSEKTIQKLEAKTTQIIDNSHEAVAGYNDFVVSPVLSVDESSTVEGGLQNISVSTVTILFSIRQQTTGTVFGSISKKIKGSGNNKTDAIANAVNKINTKDVAYGSLIAQAKAKILSYYVHNCHSIIVSAEAAESRKDYEQAIGMLQTIPSPAPCFDEAQKKLTIAYDKYQKAYCNKNIYDAKTHIAAQDYSSALETLRMIDPSADCGKDAEKLIAEIGSRVDKDEMKAYNLEQQRITALQEICKAYFSRAGKRR